VGSTNLLAVTQQGEVETGTVKDPGDWLLVPVGYFQHLETSMGK
jgi:hypothetical protein